MIAGLTQRWWVFLVRGLCAIALAVVAFTQPAATLLALIIVWGAYAVSDGVMALWAGWADRQGGRGMWPLLIVGVASLVAGLTAWIWPQITAFVLLAIIASWSIVRGLFEIVAAIRLRRVIENEWLLITTGALSLLFGIVLLSRPRLGLLALVYLIGSYALVCGILLVVLAFRLRSLRGRIDLT
jgi:uncharacterized membrane protein HdeD (DUF308 family)